MAPYKRARRTASVPLAGVAFLTVLALSGCTPGSSLDSEKALVLDVETASIADLGELLTSGDASSVDIAAAYVDRIQRVNTEGPGLRAVQSLVSTWREQAQAADQRRADGETVGPLDGIPVIVKDNIDIEGEVTSAGSLALADNVATSDATIVTALREAGAVIIAKATMVELAFWNGGTSWGYSSLGGQPLNPYDASYETSGSSSGPGIAAAAGLAAITFGTDTGGSVITPAEKMSLVGYRPTTGLISRTGIVPVTSFSDTAGVMGRGVTDVAIGAEAIVGVDDTDPATAASEPYQGIDFAGQLSADALQGARIGVVNDPTLTDDQEPLWNATVEALTKQGATVVPVEMTMTDFPFTATTYEFRENLDEYLSERTADDFSIKSVTELADFYRANPDDTQKYGAATLFGAEAVDLSADAAAAEADLDTAQTTARSNVDGLLASLDLNAFLFSENSTVQFEAAIGSYPEVTVPAGYTASDRHPFGVILMGARWDDANLFDYAYSLEQATQARRTPSEMNPTMWRCVTVHTDDGHCLP